MIENELFNRCKTTLKKTSYDKENKEYMTDSTFEVICFDDVKKKFSADLEFKEIPKSNDALVVSKKGYCFIEFKNKRFNFKDNKLDNKDIYELWLKNYDSMLIFSNITGVGVDFICKNMDYILVYSEEKTPSLSKFAEGLSKRGGMKFNKFNLKLDKFENLCFREVFTYSKQEFEKEFVSKFERS